MAEPCSMRSLPRFQTQPAQSRSNDDPQSRMSHWAVFEAVMGPESFSSLMSGHRRPLPSPPPRSSLQDLAEQPAVHDPAQGHPQSRCGSPSLPRPSDPPPPSPSPCAPAASSVKRLFRPTWAALSRSFRRGGCVCVRKLPESFRTHHKEILKCSIAYLVASLFSFWNPLADLLAAPYGLDGPFSGAHVVATIVTYYRPARTVGSMMQANHYAFWGLVWLAVLVVGSTLTSVLIENRSVSHAIILVVFVGLGYGTAAWVKQKSPGFASTCSMIIVISCVIITREGSIHHGYLDFKKSLLYTEIVLLAMLISNLICLGFSRASATSKLQVDLNRTLDSFSTLIGMLTKTFLLDQTIYTNQEHLKNAIDRHHASFTSLKQSLDAAMYEFFEPRIQRSHVSYREAVGSMNRLAQHLTGLRSGCGLQFEIMEASRAHHNSTLADMSSTTLVLDPSSGIELLQEVFAAFCESMGPSLKTLMATGVACLHQVKALGPTHSSCPLVEERGESEVGNILRLKAQLLTALAAFQSEHSLAMKQLYLDFCQRTRSDSGWSGLSTQSLTPPKERIFLISFFLFNMEEFMKELSHLLGVFADIRADEQLLASEAKFKRKMWNPCRFMAWFKPKNRSGRLEGRPRSKARQQRPTFTAVLPRDSKFRTSAIAQWSTRRGQGEQNSTFSPSSWSRGQRELYHFFQHFHDPHTRTAIKIGAGAAVMVFPAFWDVTRPLFHEYRGQWAVVTYMIVMASTLGQTNFLATMRMVGTLIGSAVAVVAYHMFWEDPVALPIVGFLFSIPCFWLIVCHPNLASTGRFLLLSYNLVCLYSYNVRDDDVHISVTAYRRFLCVFVGVFFGWVVNNLIWPHKARSELRKNLSEFLLECAFMYSFIAKRYSAPSTEADQDANGRAAAGHSSAKDLERTPLLASETSTVDQCSLTAEFSSMELFLQVRLIELFSLLSATKHEPRLKGPFPHQRYWTMLNACQSLLDMLHSLRSVTGRRDWFHSVRQAFLAPARAEHRELVGNILLYFGLLSTSIELKSPLPPYLPPAHQARERLLKKIHMLPIGTDSPVEQPNTRPCSNQSCSREDRHLLPAAVAGEMCSASTVIEEEPHDNPLLLFFAFSVALRHIINNLVLIGGEAQGLFGIIGGAQNLDEFEVIFGGGDSWMSN